LTLFDKIALFDGHLDDAAGELHPEVELAADAFHDARGVNRDGASAAFDGARRLHGCLRLLVQPKAGPGEQADDHQHEKDSHLGHHR
jgi:hypothetical protein